MLGLSGLMSQTILVGLLYREYIVCARDSKHMYIVHIVLMVTESLITVYTPHIHNMLKGAYVIAIYSSAYVPILSVGMLLHANQCAAAWF